MFNVINDVDIIDPNLISTELKKFDYKWIGKSSTYNTINEFDELKIAYKEIEILKLKSEDDIASLSITDYAISSLRYLIANKTKYKNTMHFENYIEVQNLSYKILIQSKATKLSEVLLIFYV